ncbi:hypothetical protein SDIAM26S_03266 [Streptomyces diastaticus subsp. diastaticus]
MGGGLPAVGPGHGHGAVVEDGRLAEVPLVGAELRPRTDRCPRRGVQRGGDEGPADDQVVVVDGRLVAEIDGVAQLLAPADLHLVPAGLRGQQAVLPDALADPDRVVEAGAAGDGLRRALDARRPVLGQFPEAGGRLCRHGPRGERLLDRRPQLQRPARLVGVLGGDPFDLQVVRTGLVAGGVGLRGRDTADRAAERQSALVLVEGGPGVVADHRGLARGVYPQLQPVGVADRNARLRYGRHAEVGGAGGVQLGRVPAGLAGADGVEVLAGREGGCPLGRRGALDRVPPELVATGGEFGGALELAGEGGGVRGVVVGAVPGLRDAGELLAGLPLHLEADGVDPEAGSGLGELLGGLAGRRGTAVVLAVGDEQDGTAADRAGFRLGQVGDGLLEGEPDRGVALGLDPGDRLLHRVPVQRLHGPGEPGVGTAAGAVGPVDPQSGRVTVGEAVDHGADRVPRRFHAGTAVTRLVGHGAGGVEDHDETAGPVPPLGGLRGTGRGGGRGRAPGQGAEHPREEYRRRPAAEPSLHRSPCPAPAVAGPAPTGLFAPASY